MMLTAIWLQYDNCTIPIIYVRFHLRIIIRVTFQLVNSDTNIILTLIKLNSSKNY